MMRTRGDHRVHTEPFSIAYYLGPQKCSGRYETSHPEAGFDEVLSAVLATTGPAFVKEMPYQLGPLLNADVVGRFDGSFLIRDPAYALPSLARVWPDFTDDETGYAAQHLAWTLLRSAGEDPPIIDSDELCGDPLTVVGAWCDAVGIERRPDALVWEPGMPEEWKIWEEWVTSAASTRGFLSSRPGPPAEISVELAHRIDRCRPFYEELHEHRLTT
jgi:hypothetical protein